MRLSVFDGINRQSITHVLVYSLIRLKNTRYAVKQSRVSFYTLAIQNLTPLAESDNCVACNREVSFATLFNSSGFVGQYHIKVSGQYKNKVKNGMDENTFPRSTSGPLSWSASQKNEVEIVCLAKQLNTYSTLSISKINHKECLLTNT
ncbi:MAG: hypothetical protein JKY53_15135 [Flavobacteriales bacterium]|nr:hypothetical protein [Flavobacteriales bacterium]